MIEQGVDPMRAPDTPRDRDEDERFAARMRQQADESVNRLDWLRMETIREERILEACRAALDRLDKVMPSDSMMVSGASAPGSYH